jgi:hypothetical protein
MGGFGAYVGDKLYDYGAKKFKSWTGYGDYTIKSNSLINTSGQGGDPIIETRGRTIRISYREYLGEVTTGATSGAFNATSYTINPANILSFPWLAPIAMQYDQYKPLGIIYEFKSTASDSTTNVALGSVMMATEYDVLDSPFASKQEMLNAAYSSECKASDSMLHGIECDPGELQRTVFYTRRSNVNVASVRDYDLGVFTVATQGGGLPANQSIGSLYVHYEFELLKEQVFGGLASKDRFWSIYSNPTMVPALRTFSAYYGTTPASMLGYLYAGIDMGIYVNGGTIYFPRKWAGATFRILLTYLTSAVFQTGSTTPGLTTSCSVVQQPTFLTNGNQGNNTATWTNIVTSLTINEYVSSAMTLVKLDDVINTTYASMDTTYIGFFAGSNNARLRMEIEIVPSDWYSPA